MTRKVRIDMTDRRYGRLVAIEPAHRDASGHAHWRFACDCGAQTVAHGGNVRSGKTRSCGCLHRETSATRLTVHGARADRRHGPTYRAWQQMNASGISCPLRIVPCWRTDFTTFRDDLGERPAGTGLVRIDPMGAFAPDNCRWAPITDRAARAEKGWGQRRAAAATDATRLLAQAAMREHTAAAVF